VVPEEPSMEDREDEEDSVAATHNMNNEAGY
jgi:hypothetical protein